jgi:ORF6N domain
MRSSRSRVAKGIAVVKAQRTALAPVEHITQSILVFRGHKVLLDEDLAALYGVQTGVLVQAVKRNSGRFPADFMFQLNAAEWTVLRSRIVIPTPSRGGRRFAPYVFTEQGVAMLSSVLGSERAIAVNIEIMRAFVKLRELLVSNKELARRFDQLEARVDKLIAHDEAIAAILSAIRELMAPPPPPPKRRPIGFTAELGKKS